MSFQPVKGLEWARQLPWLGSIYHCITVRGDWPTDCRGKHPRLTPELTTELMRRGKKKKKKTWRKEQNIYALWWLTPLSLWKQNKERRGGEWESKEGKKKKKKTAAKWWMMRRMEKQISPSFQSGILMGFVCVTRRRGCLTGLKEIFRVQAADMSIEREPQDSGPMWCGSGMRKTP